MMRRRLCKSFPSLPLLLDAKVSVWLRVIGGRSLGSFHQFLFYCQSGFQTNLLPLFNLGDATVPNPDDAVGDIVEIPGEQNIFAIEDAAFINAVRTGDPSSVHCPYEDGAKTAAVTLAVNESLATGKPVVVPQL